MTLGSTYGSSFGTTLSSTFGNLSSLGTEAKAEKQYTIVNPELVFERNEKTELYCTNCDRYFKDQNFFDHVKVCDREYV